MTNGSSGRVASQSGASFNFNVTGGGLINGIFLLVTPKVGGGRMSLQVNGGEEELVNLNSQASGCQNAPLNLGSSQLSSSSQTFKVLLGSEGETLVTAKILTSPAEVDGAIVQQAAGNSGGNPLRGSLIVCFMALIQSVMLLM